MNICLQLLIAFWSGSARQLQFLLQMIVVHQNGHRLLGEAVLLRSPVWVRLLSRNFWVGSYVALGKPKTKSPQVALFIASCFLTTVIAMT